MVVFRQTVDGDWHSTTWAVVIFRVKALKMTTAQVIETSHTTVFLKTTLTQTVMQDKQLILLGWNHFYLVLYHYYHYHIRVIPQYSVCCGGEIQRHLSCYSFIDIWHLLLVTYWGCKSSRKLSFPLPCFSPKFIFETTEHQEGAVAEGNRDFSGMFVF